MLEAARLALCETGVLAANDRMPPFSVRMSGNLVFLVYPHDSAFYAVKVGTQSDLRREYEGLMAGRRLFPVSVPRVLGWSQHRTFPTLVTEGIPYLPLGIEQMRGGNAQLAGRLEDFLQTCRDALVADVAVPASRRVEDANRRLGSPVDQATWTRYCASIRAEVDRLPPVRQHGDFYVHNLGLHEGSLVVLDWEDFGLESMPGLDLALFLLSLNDFRAGALRENTRPGGPHAWILEAGCRGCDIPPDTFMRCLPAYIALSARMKHDLGYGDVFAARARATLPEALALVGCDGPVGEAAR